MNKIIDFFINNPKLNYILLLFLVIGGIFSYQKMPKEIFPPIVLDEISISGGYSGASADILNKIAVTPIEEEIDDISGIKKITTTITSNIFKIKAQLDGSVEKSSVLDRIKDAIKIAKEDFPDDMDEPTATQVIANFPLILINISSNDFSHDFILKVTKKLKSRLSNIKNLTDIHIYGEGDKQMQISINTKILNAYHLNPNSVVAAISNISSIFPIGKISQKGAKNYFISTYNGVKTPEQLMQSIIKVDGKIFRLKDIATIKKIYKNDETISSFNGRHTITINISKTEHGNAIELTKKIKNVVKEFQKEYPKLYFGTFSDTSVYITNRLNTVISNIILGLILVGITLYLLVNKRISFIVILGIPTSFVISLMLFYAFGYSINMMSLLGALIALGVIVDDAIIVAENIQRHIEEDMPISQAVLVGTKEVLPPVLASSITTVFAFLPMLLITDAMGEFIKIIPIAISILILSSVIESFVFLPLHAKHLLKKGQKRVDWSYILNIYEKLLRLLIHKRKTSLVLFFILTPLLIYLGFSSSKYQLFPSFDGEQMNISAKLPKDTTLQESFFIASDVERFILKNKEKYHIQSATTMAGFRVSPSGGKSTMGDNLFHIFVDLEKAKPSNFVARYITPYLSFDYDFKGRTRDISSYDLEGILQKDLSKVMAKYDYEEFEVKGPRAGIADIPIEIYVQTNDEKKALKILKRIKKALHDTNQTKNITDNAAFGVEEIKLKVNRYGQSLGLSEKAINTTLARYFLTSTISKGIDKDGIFDIVIKDKEKNNIQTLKEFHIFLNDGKEVLLKDVVEFIPINNYEKIYKQQGQRRWLVSSEIKNGANANEILHSIKPLLNSIKKDEHVKIIYGGEEEQNSQLAYEMSVASMVALFLMFMTLLVMFNSFSYTLMILSVIPFSILGVFFGHLIMGLDLSMPSIIGILGLCGVVINDGIIMLDFIRNSRNIDELIQRARLRLRPIFLTSITTLAGLSTLIFFPSGQAVILQPLAVSLGFGLFWGTFLNLIYLPTLFALITHTKERK